MICPNCHQPVASDASFCGNCGFKLTGEQSVAESSTQPTTPPTPTIITREQFSQPIMANSSPVTPPAATAVQPQNGAVVQAPTISNASSVQSDKNAVIAFVCGVLGCIGWLIPIVGLILGGVALSFGTRAVRAKTKHKTLAVIGIVLAIPVIILSIINWTAGTTQYLKRHSGSGAQSSVDTPCYTIKLSTSLSIVRNANSCTLQALNKLTGEQYVIKVLDAPGLTANNIEQAAKEDSTNVLNSLPGGSIASQDSTTFVGSPGYTLTLKATDGSAATLAYVYKTTTQGNLVIVMHSQRGSSNVDLTTLENNWVWK